MLRGENKAVYQSNDIIKNLGEKYEIFIHILVTNVVWTPKYKQF